MHIKASKIMEKQQILKILYERNLPIVALGVKVINSIETICRKISKTLVPNTICLYYYLEVLEEDLDPGLPVVLAVRN